MFFFWNGTFFKRQLIAIVLVLLWGTRIMWYLHFRMKIFPKIKIIHTSSTTEGQIYIPALNFILAVVCIILVCSFQSSERLAALYGLAVCGDMTFTSFFFAILTKLRWNWYTIPWLLVICEFLLVDLSFLSAAFLKVPEGAWFTIAFAVLLFMVMYVWRWGKIKVEAKIQAHQFSFDSLVRAEETQALKRFDRAGVYLTSVSHGLPSSLIELTTHSPFLQSTVIFLTIKYAHVPVVSQKYKTKVVPLNMIGCYRVIVYQGYRELSPHVPNIIEGLKERIPELKRLKISYFIGIENIKVDPKRNIFYRLLLHTFAFLLSISHHSANEFSLPSESTISLGQDIYL